MSKRDFLAKLKFESTELTLTSLTGLGEKFDLDQLMLGSENSTKPTQVPSQRRQTSTLLATFSPQKNQKSCVEKLETFLKDGSTGDFKLVVETPYDASLELELERALVSGLEYINAKTGSAPQASLEINYSNSRLSIHSGTVGKLTPSDLISTISDQQKQPSSLEASIGKAEVRFKDRGYSKKVKTLILKPRFLSPETAHNVQQGDLDIGKGFERKNTQLRLIEEPKSYFQPDPKSNRTRLSYFNDPIRRKKESQTFGFYLFPSLGENISYSTQDDFVSAFESLLYTTSYFTPVASPERDSRIKDQQLESFIKLTGQGIDVPERDPIVKLPKHLVKEFSGKMLSFPSLRKIHPQVIEMRLPGVDPFFGILANSECSIDQFDSEGCPARLYVKLTLNYVQPLGPSTHES